MASVPSENYDLEFNSRDFANLHLNDVHQINGPRDAAEGGGVPGEQRDSRS